MKDEDGGARSALLALVSRYAGNSLPKNRSTCDLAPTVFPN